MRNNRGNVLSGCFGLFFLFILAGVVTNLYRSYVAESSRSQRLVATQATVTKWEEKWFNNGEDQFPYAQCTVSFQTEDGNPVEIPLMTIFDQPEVELDQSLGIVYDPQDPSYAKAAGEPDEWPQTEYYAKTTVLCVLLILVFGVVARSKKSKEGV